MDKKNLDKLALDKLALERANNILSAWWRVDRYEWQEAENMTDEELEYAMSVRVTAKIELKND